MIYMTPFQRPSSQVDFSHFYLDSPASSKQLAASALTSSSHDTDFDDPFHAISKMLPLSTDSARFWWHTTGAPFAQMIKRASYPIRLQYRYLLFYYIAILPEFGDDSLPALSAKKSGHGSLYSKGCKRSSYGGAPQTSNPVSIASAFQSYMTDDHTPIELSWQFDSEGGAVARFAIDPVRRQVERDPRGAMGLFEDFASSKYLVAGSNLDWCRICAQHLTLPTVPDTQISNNRPPEYPSQYFVGFDFSPANIIMKAYFLPETRAALTVTPTSSLITSCILALSTSPTPSSPSPPDLITPWKRALAFFSSLPAELAPSFTILAVDCVDPHRNRVKVYVRTPRTTLATIRRFFTLGRDPAGTSAATQRAIAYATLLWRLLFPKLAHPDCDDVEPPLPQRRHPTAGLLWYYELRPGHSEPFPKVYLPVRHWCKSDQHVVRVMEAFYTFTGNLKAAERYGRDVQATYKHRRLSSRTGIHTYITLAVKPDDVELTSYFNPECYAPERHLTL